MPEPITPQAERPWEDVARMLDVDTALRHVLAAFAALPPEMQPLLDANGMVLAEKIVARDPVPPFRNSAMDGYAVRSADTREATWTHPVSLHVIAEAAAGQRQVAALGEGQAVRIMTGAQLPCGADAVVRFEETDEFRQSGSARPLTVTIYRAPRSRDNVREAGEDVASGTIVGWPGQRLGPADLGLLAAVGHAAAPVHRRPVVAILSTGDELVEPGEDLPPGAIRDSNTFVIGALAKSWGAHVLKLGIARDVLLDLKGRLEQAAAADLIVTSGGVSLGDYDLVKDVLKAEGEVAIWQVRMKPGKPLAFGHIGGTPLLGLPGNPVAAAVSFVLFGRPAILKMLGHSDVEPHTIDVTVGQELDNRGQRRHYVRVRLENRGSESPTAFSVGEQGAGILSSLAAADALLVVPETCERVPAGARLRAIPLEW